MVQKHGSKKQRAIALRLQGKSYGEIKKILVIPSKGTLSYWFKNLELPPKAKQLLANKITLARKRGLFKYNHNRIKAITVENKGMFAEAKQEIGKLSKRELLLVGSALYWGEGTKSERNKNSLSVALSNSDPQLIALFMKFVREVLNVNDEKIQAGIITHPNVNIKETKKFWSNITKLPEERFSITVQVSRVSKLRRSKKSLPFGTVSIRVNRRPLFYKIKGYINGLAEN